MRATMAQRRFAVIAIPDVMMLHFIAERSEVEQGLVTVTCLSEA